MHRRNFRIEIAEEKEIVKWDRSKERAKGEKQNKTPQWRCWIWCAGFRVKQRNFKIFSSTLRVGMLENGDLPLICFQAKPYAHYNGFFIFPYKI